MNWLNQGNRLVFDKYFVTARVFNIVKSNAKNKLKMKRDQHGLWADQDKRYHRNY